MYFVIGLGNPGTQYNLTRHNIGFEVIDKFAHDHHISLDTKKHKAIIGQGVVHGEKVMLIKPQTYMNLSGESIREVLNFYKEDHSSLIIIFDDISLDIGALRIRLKGSAGGHNGIKSIIQHLGTNEFTRIKVGVSEKPPGWDLANYVLTRFSKEELPIAVKAIEEASNAVESIIKEGPTVAMNAFNIRDKGNELS